MTTEDAPDAADAEPLRIEVAYALPDRQIVVRVQLPSGATVGDALAAVAMRAPFDAIDIAAAPVGVFGDRCERQRVLADGDRVEIYRPLLIDPREARRLRASGR
jgi:uncharacterized protein